MQRQSEAVHACALKAQASDETSGLNTTGLDVYSGSYACLQEGLAAWRADGLVLSGDVYACPEQYAVAYLDAGAGDRAVAQLADCLKTSCCVSTSYECRAR